MMVEFTYFVCIKNITKDISSVLNLYTIGSWVENIESWQRAYYKNSDCLVSNILKINFVNKSLWVSD